MGKVTHKKTGQELKKIDRSKRKARPVQQIIKEQGLDGMGIPKPRGQQVLDAPGMKASNFPDVNEAAEKLALAQETAKSAGKARKLAHDVLVQKLLAHGQRRYSDRSLGVVVEITATERAKLKKLDDGSKKRRRGKAYP